MKSRIAFIAFLPLFYAVTCRALTEGEGMEQPPWHELCVIDDELAELRDKLENTRTDCLCTRYSDVKDKLCKIQDEIDSLRQGCFCGLTEGNPTTNYPSVTPEFTYPTVTPSNYPSEYTTTNGYMHCPQGMTEFQNRCYIYMGDIITWYEAYGTCITLYDGGYLAEADNEFVNSFLIGLWNSSTGDQPPSIGPWLGAYNDGYAWRWSDSQKELSYSDWYEYEDVEVGEPWKCLSFIGGDDCVLQWGAFPCDSHRDFICAVDLSSN